jgi:VWFA-related protein
MRIQSHIRLAIACVVFAFAVGMTAMTRAQDQRPPGRRSSDNIIVSTDEVLIDAVVRDKRGRLVKDLTASDFEVFEDGVRQDINSFRRVVSASGSTDTASTTASTDRSDRQVRASDSGTSKNAPEQTGAARVSTVALVFDRLSPDARTRAYKAALSYLEESAHKDELFGVFLTDLTVLVLQPFTEDRELVKSAIEKAGLHSPSLYTSNNEKTRSGREEATKALLKQQMGGREQPGLGGRAQTLLEWLEEMERNQQGDATTRGLLFIASSLSALPGRKAVIFFSEGLILPPLVMENFRAIINAANRNNVSFYTVDAGGLRVESKTAETTREIKSRSDLRMAQLGSTSDLSGPMTKGLERNEDLLRLNPDTGLGQLAGETGGFLITDSNDLKNKLRQVDEDLHTYYMISYGSKNPNYDGHFRRIEIKLKRPGLAVQGRRGYFAIKGTFASPVLNYEVPAIAALDRTPTAKSFPLYAGGFSFPEPERIGLAPVLVDVPLSAFTFNEDLEKKVYGTDFTILALLKDQAGQVVDKLSHQYRLNGPLNTLAQTKLSRVLFYREADLAPGRYTLEIIAYDSPTGRASVRTEIIEVHASDEAKLRVSDVVMLKRAEPANAADEKRSNPFQVGNLIVSPNLGEPIRRSLKQVPFFFTVYQPSGASIRAKLTIELQQHGRTLAQIPGEMPAADASGRIQYVSALSVEKIPAGSYELRITVSDQSTSLTRSRFFTIED